MRARLLSIDTLRGAVMILMALDHTRDYFSNARFSPLDLAHTTPALFFTRWITHFCAPAFVLLAGTSAYLWAASPGKSKPELARFLLARGVWLIVLELTVIRFAWFLTLDYEVLLAQVIWAIGWSMILLAGLVFLPDWLILTFGAALIAGHNLFDRAGWGGGPGALWTVLHRESMLGLWPGHSLYVLYPLVPWIGVMALGYVLGRLFLRGPRERRAWLLRTGSGLLLGFTLLRFSNLYGDPLDWHSQRNGFFTLLSFLNVEKYPPSFHFLLMTLGPILIALALLERAGGCLAEIPATFGRVPLFFYVLHLYGIHLLAVGAAWLRYGRADWLFGLNWFFRDGYPPDYGYNLLGVYLVWLAVMAALYPACRWFAALKRRSGRWWLSYL
jgi:uncharacterized membrane protein